MTAFGQDSLHIKPYERYIDSAGDTFTVFSINDERLIALYLERGRLYKIKAMQLDSAYHFLEKSLQQSREAQFQDSLTIDSYIKEIRAFEKATNNLEQTVEIKDDQIRRLKWKVRILIALNIIVPAILLYIFLFG